MFPKESIYNVPFHRMIKSTKLQNIRYSGNQIQNASCWCVLFFFQFWRYMKFNLSKLIFRAVFQFLLKFEYLKTI